jgi:putative DNA primase/helicase
MTKLPPEASNENRINKTAYTDCPSCGYKNSLAITQTRERTLYFCHAGCSQEALWRTLQSLEPFITPRTRSEQSTPAVPVAFISALWERSRSPVGTVVETYLRMRRISAEIPPSIRFLPNHFHKPTHTYWPVMLAAISDAKGRMLALHRTYLAPDGSAKAQVQPPKMTLGQVAGLACHLATPSNDMAVAEGIETALSVQLATGIPTWAALSAGGLRRLILPSAPNAGLVTIGADADVVGIQAARIAAHRWKSEGRQLRVIVPSRPGTDFNDLIMQASP